MERMDLLEKAEKIYKQALAEVDPEKLIKKNVSKKGREIVIQERRFDLSSYKNIFLLSIGKAAPYMAKSLLGILGSRISEGIVLCPPHENLSLHKNIRCLPASHPLPDGRSVAASQKILALSEKAGEKDLFIVLISGGGSSQICLPAQGVSLEDKRLITEELLKAGASITELNTVRKHLSRIKGGRLAEVFFPATIINLVISDVIRNDLGNIASGPTYWDSSTYTDARKVLEKYNLWDRAPFSVKEVIKKGIDGQASETLKKENRVFKNVSSFIIGDNLVALKAARKKAQNIGFKSFILTSSDQGEAREVAKNYVSLLMNLAYSKKIGSEFICLLAGGELTVTVKGKGRGGRNMEFALAALLEGGNLLKGIKDWLIMSLGSDGIDGPTDAAGAWVGPSTLEKAKKFDLNPKDYLDTNDSYNFFKKAGGLIVTGPTHTNVMDLRFFLLKISSKNLLKKYFMV